MLPRLPLNQRGVTGSEASSDSGRAPAKRPSALRFTPALLQDTSKADVASIDFVPSLLFTTDSKQRRAPTPPR